MARTVLAPTMMDDAGVNPAAVLGTVDGHSLPNFGSEILVIRNTGAGAHVVTIPTPASRDDLAVADRTINIPAGQTRFVGPFTPSLYNQPGADSDKLFVNFDATPAELSVQALRMPE